MKQAAIFLGLSILLFTISFMLNPADPTDKDKWNRSGMAWHKDYGTGCEYLAGSGFLGKAILTPRYDKDGNHICSESK